MKKFKEAIESIKNLDAQLMQKTQERLDSLTKPKGSLGRLEDLAKQIVGITRKEKPSIKNKVIFTLASDHGVTEEKVSAYPQEVTAQMVYNFLRGGAGLNVLARHIGARMVVVDMGVVEKIKEQKIPACRQAGKIKNFKDRKINLGTKNFAKGQAMSKEEAIGSIETGIAVFEDELKKGIDIVGTGDMGIGNTTASSAITAAITGKSVEEVTGRGTGLDDKALLHKIEVIKTSLNINQPNSQDALDVLAKVGGFEIGGLVGIIIGCASKRIPLVIDGFISGTAALIANQLEPKVKDYMIAGHCSVERGHRVILDYLGLKPLLDLNLRLGEGTGACLGINLVEAAIKILTDMATFKEAEVCEKIE